MGVVLFVSTFVLVVLLTVLKSHVAEIVAPV